MSDSDLVIVNSLGNLCINSVFDSDNHSSCTTRSNSSSACSSLIPRKSPLLFDTCSYEELWYEINKDIFPPSASISVSSTTNGMTANNRWKGTCSTQIDTTSRSKVCHWRKSSVLMELWKMSVFSSQCNMATRIIINTQWTSMMILLTPKKFLAVALKASIILVIKILRLVQKLWENM